MKLARLCLLILGVQLVGCGITAPRFNDGYADLDSLGFSDTDRTMSLSLGPTVMRFAAAHIEDDPETREMVSQLDGVRVRTYDIVGDRERVADRIDRMNHKLKGQGWTPVIRVREAGETTVMLVKERDDHIAGITVITCDSHEAVIVNVMGELRPEMFAATMEALDVDVGTGELAQASVD